MIPSPVIAFESLPASDHDAVARLLHQSLVQWYEGHLRQGFRFGDRYEPFRLYPQVYEALDPGEAVTAREPATGKLLGVCFSHERETHIAIGIVATAAEAAGRGIARRMMAAVLDRARERNKPARLVSSLLNLDSFSLYNRLGFVPGQIFQDMALAVPTSGLPARPDTGCGVRDARPGDIAALAELEFNLQGIRRQKDLAFFLRNEVGSWRLLVSEAPDGSPDGFLALSTHPDARMVGPGVAADPAAGISLLWHALDALRGSSPVFLLPVTATAVVQAAYAWGARNVELHVAQSTRPAGPGRGVVFPTFLPESG